MNLQESIRRILREETKELNMILRRIRINELEEEFRYSLNYVSKLFKKNKTNRHQFKKMIITDLISNLQLRHRFPYYPEFSKFYVTLEKFFKNEIDSKFDSLTN